MRKTAIKNKLATVLIALMIAVAALSGWSSLAGQVSAADSSVKLTYVSPSKIYSDSSKSKSKTEKSSKKTTKSKNKGKSESKSDSSNGAPGQAEDSHLQIIRVAHKGSHQQVEVAERILRVTTTVELTKAS